MSADIKRWLIPPGIEEELPEEARHVENLRREMFNLFDNWGYDPVVPPLIEYLDSLLVMDDKELQAQTLKLTDHKDGKMMGLRADMTPQVARIDANRLITDDINRLCYVGTVLRATPANVGDMRRVVQFGAEIYGHSGIDSSIEVIRLMITAIQLAELRDLHLDIGHIGIYLDLVKTAKLSRSQENTLFDLMHLKSAHEIQQYLSSQQVSSKLVDNFIKLLELHGDVAILDKASSVFDSITIRQHLDEIKTVSERLDKMNLGVRMHYDLAELGQYQYETGIVFSVLDKTMGQEVARGGRYDNIGAAFGRARAAVGFSSDLTLLAALQRENNRLPNGIFAPYVSPESSQYEQLYQALHQEIARLRNSGERVVEQLDKGSDAAACYCDRVMAFENETWTVRKI